MLTFRTSRVAQDPRTSESRRAFLRQHGNGLRVGDFCDALAAAYAARPGDKDLKTRNREQQADRGYPWVSLVLGSGCVERLHLVPEDASEGLPHRHLPHLVHAALEGRPNFNEEPEIYDGSPAELARDFVASLLKDRLDEKPEAPPALADADPDVAENGRLAHTATLCLLAALLTRLYYASKVVENSAPVTRGEEYVEASDDLRYDHPIHLYREEVRKLRREILQDLGEDEGALESLLNRIGAELGDNRLALLDVQLLTEIAWFYLTRDLDAYPGWSDMLAELAIRQELPLADRYADKHGPRPLFDSVIGVAASLASVFESATKKSWSLVHDSRTSSPGGDRGDLHAAAARLLRRQADLYNRTNRLPPPSAFVTTFDLELEMALWNLGSPFMVALPVHVQVEGVDEVVSCWLGRVVTPVHGEREEELAALRDPGAVDDWFVMSAETRWGGSLKTATGTPIGKTPLPVVVRLSGSPLMNLPVLGKQAFAPLQQKLQTYLKSYLDSLSAAAEPGDHPENLRLHAAVIVDEYASLRHSLSELYRYSGDRELRQGLPDAVTDGSSDDFARYWILLGVQLGDPGMRQRFSAQLLSPLLVGGQKSPPSPAGLAVTKRADDVLARDLVRWHGFDVVHAKCEEFTGDLLHCLKHLEVEPPSLGYTRSGEECEVDTLLEDQLLERQQHTATADAEDRP